MAYYQFDLTIINFSAYLMATPNFYDLKVTARFSGSDLYDNAAYSGGAGDFIYFTSNTSSPSTFAPFELSASDKVWFDLESEDENGLLIEAWRVGPYTVGDVGTEVPAP